MKHAMFLAGSRPVRHEAVAWGVVAVLLGALLVPCAAEAYLHSIPPQSHGCSVLSPDRTKLLTGAGDGKEDTANLWDAVTGKCVGTFTGHKRGVWSVAFSADGKKALTGSEDCTAKLWDVATGVCIQTFTGHTSAVASVAMSPDGTRVLTGSKDSTARLWDATTGAAIYIYNTSFTGPDERPEWVQFVLFSPDGTKLLAVTEHGTVRLWDAHPTEARVREKDGGAVRKPGEHGGAERGAASPSDNVPESSAGSQMELQVMKRPEQ